MNECKRKCWSNGMNNSCNMNTMNNMDKILMTNTMEDDCENDMFIPQNHECNMCNNNMNNEKENSCECGFDTGESAFPMNYVLGQSYVPIQKMNRVFTPENGLKMGTIFPELVSSYVPCQGIKEIEQIKNMNEIGEGCNK